MSNPQTIAASEARNNFSDLVSKVQYQGQVFLIERYGEIVAQITPVKKASTEVTVEEKTEVQEDEKPELIAKPLEQQQDEKGEAWKQKLDEQLRQMDRMSSLHNPHRQVYTPPIRVEETKDDISQDDQKTQKDQFTESTEQTEQKNDSGWSALRKLEELIAAQRAKATHQTSTTSEQSERTEQDYERDEQPIAEQTSQNYQSQQIIRKKIEL